MLLFKRQFLPAIRRGEKTQTIRLWKHRRMKPGQKSYIPGVGPIRITAIDEVRLEDLTDADALPDGFPSAAQLRSEIARLYPAQIAAGYRAYRVAFAMVPPDSREEPNRAQTADPDRYVSRRRGKPDSNP
jgi:hypothetical protein